MNTNKSKSSKANKPDGRMVRQLARLVDTALPSKANKQRKQQKAKEAAAGITSVRDIAAMLTDPCGAVLKPGTYGSSSGYMARFHGVSSPMTQTNSTCGVVLWAPNYFCKGWENAQAVTTYNAYTAAATSTADTLLFNNVPNGAVNGSGFGIEDPAYKFVNGATCASARCVSACLKLTYTGAVVNSAGSVSPIRVPFAVLEGIVNGSVVPTVEAFLQFASETHRLGLDTLEIKWRPSADDTFRTASASGASVVGDDPLVRVVGPSPYIYDIGTKARAEQPYLIGYVWRGMTVPPSTNIQFDLYKNIEWAPEIGSGLASQPSIQMADSGVTQRALAMLDRAAPGWDTKVATAIKSKGARAAYAAFSLA